MNKLLLTLVAVTGAMVWCIAAPAAVVPDQQLAVMPASGSAPAPIASDLLAKGDNQAHMYFIDRGGGRGGHYGGHGWGGGGRGWGGYGGGRGYYYRSYPYYAPYGYYYGYPYSYSYPYGYNYYPGNGFSFGFGW